VHAEIPEAATTMAVPLLRVMGPKHVAHGLIPQSRMVLS
jgi:hypothetical protein